MRGESSDSGHPEDRNLSSWLLIGFGAVYLAFLGVFAYLASAIDHFPGELRTVVWVDSWRTSWLDTFMKAISAPGFGLAAWTLVGVAFAVLYLRGWRKEGGLILLATLVSSGVNLAVKEAVARPRPPADVAGVFGDLDGFSFPSGHVMHYVVFLGALAAVSTWNMKPGARWLIHLALVMALMAVGVSRIYLGAHWLGDVVGGYAFGAVVLAAFVGLWRLWVRMEAPTAGRDESGATGMPPFDNGS